jgi:SAM-dependent methyltransferase
VRREKGGRFVGSPNPIDLLFGGMGKLGPGADEETLRMLRFLPRRWFDLVVDAGCGTGRQTLVLAKELNTLVHAVDNYEPFLEDLARRAKEMGVEHLVQLHCMDMEEIPGLFPPIDLLWSEGAAYNIGFAHALSAWASAVRPGGFVVVSELSWLRERVPAAVRDFFQTGYPKMRSIDENVTTARKNGYEVLATHTLPREAWVEGYYDVLEPRAKALVDHPDQTVREFAAETLREIEIFGCSEDSYGYVFYVLEV